MKCVQCGASHHPDSQQCAYCGAWLPAARRQHQAPPQAAPQPIIYNIYQAAPEPAPVPRLISPKSRWAALILCWFAGFLGVHRFYVGKIGTGFLYLFTGGFLGVGVVVDFLVILFGGFRDKDGLKLKE